MPLPDEQVQTAGPLESLVSDPIFRPRLRYRTEAFTLWERSDGPLLQLDLVPTSVSPMGARLEVATASWKKRDLTLKLTIQPDPSWQSPRTDGLGLLDLSEAGDIRELGTRWDDHISGTARCTLQHLDRLAQLLQAHGDNVQWVVTTDHLQHSSDLPIGDWLWDVQSHPNLMVYDIAASFGSSEPAGAEPGQAVETTGLTESLVLLRQIKSLLESGVKVRLF